MKENSLKYTKQKLTIIFTLFIFILTIFLGLTFFSFKYYSSQKSSKTNFLLTTDRILRQIETKIDVLDFFGFNYILWDPEKFDDDFIDKRKKEKFLSDREISFVILDEKNHIVQKRIFENIDFGILHWINQKSFYIKSGVIVRWMNLKSSIIWNKVIFYKKLNYALEEFLEDIIFFGLITFLFSFLFCYVWYKFVSRNLEPLEKNLKYMQDFVHNAWYDLKTSVSVINSILQLIRQTKKFDEKLILRWETEASKLNKLIEFLIKFSNINLTWWNQNLNLENQVNLIIKSLESEIKNKNIKLKFDSKINFNIKSSEKHFYIFLSNLLKNIIKYTNHWWTVEIILKKNKLIVKDNWCWINKKNLDKIFRRLYQWDRSRQEEGFWIRLSLVKNILDIYNWKISLVSQEGKDSQFTIFF